MANMNAAKSAKACFDVKYFKFETDKSLKTKINDFNI